ncbi:MAG: hypothetical protein HY761_07900 [Candidatus Omnitrophica bacterium]|nr:hypothetical protein [Candidatus Omnitrophota bacterium]
MNKKYLFIGLVFILIGIWFYTALSTFEVDDTSFPGKLIIKEGKVRTEDEVAGILAKELGFDLEGAYKTGYTSADVIEYLIKQPHEFPVSFYEGKFYEGRKTVPYLIPLAVCIFLIVTGTGICLFGLKSKKAG